jgi:hypothetical protein
MVAIVSLFALAWIPNLDAVTLTRCGDPRPAGLSDA